MLDTFDFRPMSQVLVHFEIQSARHPFTHFAGIFVSFMEKEVRKQNLLAMSPIEDETSQSAAEHKKFITTTISAYYR